MNLAILSLLALTLAAAPAAPPLTDAQRTQLETARDGSPLIDEGALYPLLENALLWQAGHDSDVPPADYDALLADPAAHRGELLLIEGRFARSQRFGLVRAGPWGQALTQWVILVRRDPDEVAVVYFVDPKGELPEPRLGQSVSVAARFYKLWGDRDMKGDPATYLTFVGRTAKRTGHAAADADAAGGRDMVAVLALGPLLAAAIAAYLLLRFVRRRDIALPARRLHGARGLSRGDANEGELDADPFDAPRPPLPPDPAEAMRQLDRRRSDAGDPPPPDPRQ